MTKTVAAFAINPSENTDKHSEIGFINIIDIPDQTDRYYSYYWYNIVYEYDSPDSLAKFTLGSDPTATTTNISPN